MSNFFRQSLFVLGFVVAALLAQAIYFSLYRDWSDQARTIARKANVLLDVGMLRSQFPAIVKFEKLGAVVPVGRIPLPIAVDRGELRFDLLPFLALRADAHFKVDLYGGTFAGTVRKRGRNLELVSSANSLQLARYPQMGTVYVEGALSFDLDGLATELSSGLFSPQSMDLRLTLQDGIYRGGLTVGGVIPIVEMRDVSIDVRAALETGKLQLTEFRARTSLGDVSATGNFVVDERLRLIGGKGSFSIHLNQAGAAAYAGYLQLAADGKGTPQHERWEGELEIQKKGGIPRIVVRPLS